MQKVISLLLVSVLVCSVFTAAMAVTVKYGDPNNDSQINASDALMALKAAVGKAKLNEEQFMAADVNGDKAVNAGDALLILKYAVKKITRFPADTSGMNDQDIYYAKRDAYYGATGADFESSPLVDPYDAANVVKTMGQPADSSDVDTYQLNKEYNLDYDRIEREAKQMNTLNQYASAQKKSGTVQLSDGTKLTYSVPTSVTAYSAVPFSYSLVAGKNAEKIHVETTTFEEPARAPKTMYYSNTLPDDVSVSVKYDGYIQGAGIADADPNWNARPAYDVKGKVYPNYNPSDLVYSGTVPTDKITWLKFTATNTGNTVLKGDGQGYFCFRPFLFKKGVNTYEQVAITDNYAVRLFDAWYPGESVEFYVKFAGSYEKYAKGSYKVIISCQTANEMGQPDWVAMYVAGRETNRYAFTFDAADTGVTVPKAMTDENPSSKKMYRNNWLGDYEEFQTSFHTHLFASNDAAKPEKETIYFQPAPWDTALTLRVISDKTGAAQLVQIPLKVESDSLSITLNPYNEHYVVKQDGTREPILATQNMADMRGNCQDTPYAREQIINDLKNMKDAGINYLTSTMNFTYATGVAGGANVANRFMMDCANEMGFKFEGYGYYPYSSVSNLAGLARTYAKVPANAGPNTILGAINSWCYERFGNMFWSNAAGITPIAQEDSRGWMTVDHDWRMDLSDANVQKYQNWLKQAYGTIDKLNAAYDSDFASFAEIDPRTVAIFTDGYYSFTNVNVIDVYAETSRAVRELDLFRTINRLGDYAEVLEGTSAPGAQMIARFESGPLVTVGMKANTKNVHYRESYYQMYRAAVVGDVLAKSKEVYGVSTYVNSPFSPMETYEATKSCQRNGLTVTNFYMHYRDQIFNTWYGDPKAVHNMHLSDREMKVTAINTASALYPVLKATYEAGGIPGVMWMDYYCAGNITATQFKELQFYTAKIKEMLSTAEGRDWANNFDVGKSNQNLASPHVYSYDPAYIRSVLETTPRFNKFESPIVK